MTTKKILDLRFLFRDFRSVLDLSPKEFGRLLGISPWLVKGVEEGTIRVGRAVLERILGLISTIPWMQYLLEGDIEGSLRVASVPQIPTGARTVVIIRKPHAGSSTAGGETYLDMSVERAVEAYKAFNPGTEITSDMVVEIRLPESVLCECCGRPLPGEESVNRLIVVKGPGLKRACFLNVSQKEAVERYIYTHQRITAKDLSVEEVEFDDEFDVTGVVEPAWRVGKQEAAIVEKEAEDDHE